MKPVVWGILSVAGHYVAKTNTNVRKSPLNIVQAIASRSMDRARKAASRLGIPKAYGSYADLLAGMEIEMVYLEDPFGNVFELYSHSYELTYSKGAYQD